MAARKRGEAALSSTMEKAGEDFSAMLDVSDDEAPEEVTFEDSKERALRSVKQALERDRREKEQLKEKRRKRQELFQKQKKRRLLSAEVLDEVASPKIQKQTDVDDKKKQMEHIRTKKEKKNKLAHSRNLKGKYTITTLKEKGQMLYQQKAAEDFIQSRLYGPGSCRSTSNELLSLRNKRGPNKSAAFQFVKKNWAPERKLKAEKLKKRWIHKQQIPS